MDFACKKISIKDLMVCSFGLAKSDYNTLVLLMGSGKGLTVSDISKRLSVDRTTAQKSVKRLLDKDLVTKRQKNLENGGYIYFYTISDKEKIRGDILSIISGWTERVKKSLDYI